MALTIPTGRRLVLSSSRTRCSCSPTAWIVPEASVSVVLLRNRREMNKERLKRRTRYLFEKERERRPSFNLSISSPGQCFVGPHVGGHTEERCSPHGKYPSLNKSAIYRWKVSATTLRDSLDMAGRPVGDSRSS